LQLLFGELEMELRLRAVLRAQLVRAATGRFDVGHLLCGWRVASSASEREQQGCSRRSDECFHELLSAFSLRDLFVPLLGSTFAIQPSTCFSASPLSSP